MTGRLMEREFRFDPRTAETQQRYAPACIKGNLQPRPPTRTLPDRDN